MVKSPAGSTPLAYSSPEAVQTTGTVAPLYREAPDTSSKGGRSFESDGWSSYWTKHSGSAAAFARCVYAFDAHSTLPEVASTCCEVAHIRQKNAGHFPRAQGQ